MNENINLCEILKGHEKEEFYCSEIDENVILIKVDKNYFEFKDNENNYYQLLYHGGIWHNKKSECRFFPSKNQRDWIKWNKENNKIYNKTWDNIIINSNSPDLSIVLFPAHNGLCQNFYYEENYLENPSIIKSAVALLKIHQLIEKGYGGNITKEDWINDENKYVISCHHDLNGNFKFMIDIKNTIKYNTIIFHKQEQAEEFLSYSENIELLKDYFMINE